jgi:hypothetical protein
MHSREKTSGFVLTVAFTLALAVFFDGILTATAAGNDTAKQIERQLSSIKRNIPTSPSQAEEEWLEARDLLTELEKSAPNDSKLPKLQKDIEELGQKLEKRLGHPIGGSAPEVKKEDVPKSQQTETSGLPNSVTSRISTINAALDAVETALAKNQLQTASTKLKNAQKIMDEIHDRYSDKIPDGNEDIKAVTYRLNEVSAKYNQAETAAAKASAEELESQEKKEAQSREWIEKFSPFVDPKSDLYLRIGSDFNNSAKDEQKKYREAYAKANAMMEKYQNTDFPYGKTQELTFLEPRITSNLKYFNESESRLQQEESCREWVDKLRAYADVGAGSKKYLILGITMNQEQISEREALLNEAEAVWVEYQKADFPHGKTPELLDLEKEMQEKLTEMPEALRKSKALLAGDLEGELDRILTYLEKDTGWKNDTSKTPNIVMERDIKPLREELDRYASTVDSSDTTLLKLKDKFTRIDQTDKKNRAIRAERTFMEPDLYKGNDAEVLKERIEEIIKEKLPDVKVLRVTLRAQNWKEESVWEWTDSTHTASRFRITKFMTTQAAAKGNDGKVYLHSVHLASDRQSDGTWGPLYGHIMWSDWMAEENVNK